MSNILDRVNLDFPEIDTLYATHGLHAYAAKCPPQVARWAIERFSQADDVVLDPMAGSGTTLTEARLLGRHAVGLDLDPFARLLCKVKATPIDPDELVAANSRLIERVRHAAKRLATGQAANGADPAADVADPELLRLDHWFSRDVVAALKLVKRAILVAEASAPVRDFWWIAFTSLILARTSVANARDIVHSRHHHMVHEEPPDVLGRLVKRLGRMTHLMREFWDLCSAAGVTDLSTQVIGGDARRLPLATGIADLIFTSPPYCNALDYVRAHSLAVAWLPEVFGVSQAEYAARGRDYIGTERAMKAGPRVDPADEVDLPLVRELVRRVTASDPRKGNIIRKYFADMRLVFGELGRVARPGARIVLLVCPSHIRRVEIPTHEVFEAMTAGLRLTGGGSLKVVGRIERTIDDRKRLLPYMQEGFGRRMRTEYVLVYAKVGGEGAADVAGKT